MNNTIPLCLAGSLTALLISLVLAALTHLLRTVCAHGAGARRGAALLRQPQAVMAIVTAVLADQLGQDAAAIEIASIEKLSGKGNLYETL